MTALSLLHPRLPIGMLLALQKCTLRRKVLARGHWLMAAGSHTYAGGLWEGPFSQRVCTKREGGARCMG